MLQICEKQCHKIVRNNINNNLHIDDDPCWPRTMDACYGFQVVMFDLLNSQLIDSYAAFFYKSRKS